MSYDLLPPNSTKLEKTIAEIGLGLLQIPIPINLLWNADKCPKEFLPWLAWALSVDEWEADWDEDIKREVIKKSPNIHRRKGTIGALEDAINALGYGANIKEWFEYSGKPYYFKIDLEVTKRGLKQYQYDEILRAVKSTKNVRSHLEKIDVTLTNNGKFNLTPIINSGAILTLAPKRMDDLNLKQNINYVSLITTKASFNLNPKPMGNISLEQKINYIGILISKYQFDILPKKASNITITPQLKIAVYFATSNIFTLYPKRRYAS